MIEIMGIASSPESQSVSFLCKPCGRRFSKKSKLSRHVRESHVGEKSFVCEVCEKKFKRNSHLKRHLISHSSSPRPFACQSCSMMFSCKHHLERHEKTLHTNDFPFACELCPVRFPKRASLFKHLTYIHNLQKPHSCTECKRDFFKIGQLIRHLKRVHPHSSRAFTQLKLVYNDQLILRQQPRQTPSMFHDAIPQNNSTKPRQDVAQTAVYYDLQVESQQPRSINGDLVQELTEEQQLLNFTSSTYSPSTQLGYSSPPSRLVSRQHSYEPEISLDDLELFESMNEDDDNLNNHTKMNEEMIIFDGELNVRKSSYLVQEEGQAKHGSCAGAITSTGSSSCSTGVTSLFEQEIVLESRLDRSDGGILNHFGNCLNSFHFGHPLPPVERNEEEEDSLLQQQGIAVSPSAGDAEVYTVYCAPQQLPMVLHNQSNNIHSNEGTIVSLRDSSSRWQVKSIEATTSSSSINQGKHEHEPDWSWTTLNPFNMNWDIRSQVDYSSHPAAKSGFLQQQSSGSSRTQMWQPPSTLHKQHQHIEDHHIQHPTPQILQKILTDQLYVQTTLSHDASNNNNLLQSSGNWNLYNNHTRIQQIL